MCGERNNTTKLTCSHTKLMQRKFHVISSKNVVSYKKCKINASFGEMKYLLWLTHIESFQKKENYKPELEIRDFYTKWRFMGENVIRC